MRYKDPRIVLWVLVDRIEAGLISDKAVAWVDNAFEAAESIVRTVTAQASNGVEPTEVQLQALHNIRRAALRWLGSVPTPAEIDAAHRHIAATVDADRTGGEDISRHSGRGMRGRAIKPPPRDRWGSKW